MISDKGAHSTSATVTVSVTRAHVQQRGALLAPRARVSVSVGVRGTACTQDRDVASTSPSASYGRRSLVLESVNVSSTPAYSV